MGVPSDGGCRSTSLLRILRHGVDLSLTFIIDKDEGQKHYSGAKPIKQARFLLVEDNLTDEGKRNGQAQSDRDDNG